MKHQMIKQTILFLLAGLTGSAFAQGSLTPPGAPGAAMKTMDQLNTAIMDVSNAVSEVEVRIDVATLAGDETFKHIINQPGSYYLTGNLDVTSNSGVFINSSFVALDLNGFQISRASGSGGYGISISGGVKNNTVCNGTITGFEYGISSGGSGERFQNLLVSGCSLTGILGGNAVRIVDCTVQDNGSTGISLQNSADLSGCIAYNNAGIGIFLQRGSVLRGCTAASNRGSHGIYTEGGSILSDCVAVFNQGAAGIRSGEGSVLSQCLVYSNTVQYGIYASGGASIMGCTARNNTGINSSSYGIFAGGLSTLADCVSSYNTNTNAPGASSQGVGIYASGSTIRNCTAGFNRGDGIQAAARCFVEGNTSYSNGYNGDGAGIAVSGNDSRIENNNVLSNNRGIDVDNPGNIIVRNTCSGNGTNWTVVVNNVCLVVQATNSAAINGNSGGTSPGSTDPNANFTY
ncbi:MAG: right-handed parallel beta-helix repeat-containing protein [Pontiellaceae bacterium]|nr:right-handed parallel beta-helix repeat-containing protein [Pontiellaceae bacterium]